MRTPLYDAHKRLGARFVDFAGWEMPVQYSGILDEHRAVRERAGLFDVSHMGEVEIRGPKALDTARHLTANDPGRLRDGQVQYSMLCLPTGGVIDDVTVHRMAADRFLLCVNASNSEKDHTWMKEHALSGAEVIDRSADLALLALQGPRAGEVLQRCTALDLVAVRPFWFLEGEVAGVRVIAARTGYTGEDGFELYTPAAEAARLWAALMEEGSAVGLLPAGLGARDTLRLERALPLYGHELADDITPLEAGLDWVVKLDHDFIGRDALARQKQQGITRRLSGVMAREPGVPRQGHALKIQGQIIGSVTSGTHSPTLGKPIALGYVGVAHAVVGTRVEVEIRNRGVAAEVVSLPFYKRR